MVILRFRGASDAKEMLKKLKKMNKFTDELIECFEEKVEDDYDEDEDYRHDDDRDYEHPMNRKGSTYRRYRRSM